jgi:hypothetical protein
MPHGAKSRTARNPERRLIPDGDKMRTAEGRKRNREAAKAGRNGDASITMIARSMPWRLLHVTQLGRSAQSLGNWRVL